MFGLRKFSKAFFCPVGSVFFRFSNCELSGFCKKQTFGKTRCFMNPFWHRLLCIAGNLLLLLPSTAQKPVTSSALKMTASIGTTAPVFVESIGQYAASDTERADTRLVGFEGFESPVLIYPDRLEFLHRKQTGMSVEEREQMERISTDPVQLRSKMQPEFKKLVMQWVGTRTGAALQLQELQPGTHSYGRLPGSARRFNRILIESIYDGIDLIYSIQPERPEGFEYSLLIHPGADPAQVQFTFGGDLKQLRLLPSGAVELNSGLDIVYQSAPRAFNVLSEDAWNPSDPSHSGSKPVPCRFMRTGNLFKLLVDAQYDSTRFLLIDPFVSTASGLSGINLGKAKDVDFDYAGNVYVSGGGSFNSYQLSKFNAAGVLVWTFNGTLLNPTWSFGPYYGGWVVDKGTGQVYLGQGFAPGFRIIRINALGVYDNFISIANPAFMENWKMIWRCNNGDPQIMIAGGGINSNINLGIFSPSSTSITASNITGVPYAGGAGFAQDICDLVVDPVNHDLYSVYASLIGAPSISNKIYKHQAPYTAATINWSIPTGYANLKEADNRKYLDGFLQDNSINAFAVNSQYLFYWDGRNLKAFNKATGASVGTAFSMPDPSDLMAGGIYVNECNTVFVGTTDGIIKVLDFNGIEFNDASRADIPVAGFGGHAIYDLAFDEARQLIYASGDGFVASIDAAVAGCTNRTYQLQFSIDCVNHTAAVSLSPAPPAGAQLHFELLHQDTLVASSSTGSFLNLSADVQYQVTVFVNQACSGISLSDSFKLPAPALQVQMVSPVCGAATGAIQLTGLGGVLPYSYSIDGVHFQNTASFNGLSAGLYPVVLRDAAGCSSTQEIVLLNSNGPQINAAVIPATCDIQNGQIQIQASGNGPFQYRINTDAYSASSNFPALAGGMYQISVMDQSGCENSSRVLVPAPPAPVLKAAAVAATCHQSNGAILLQSIRGVSPFLYSLNGDVYDAIPRFDLLAPGMYSVRLKDANGCIADSLVEIADLAGPSLTATTSLASCGNQNGTISVSASSGTAPFSYSIDGATYQPSGFFSGLPAGSYTLFVKDVTGCSASVPVVLNAASAPQIIASVTTSSCAGATGSVAASATGGIPPYQYSLNGTNFQLASSFTNLAAGNYTVWVRDAGSCFAITTVVVPAVSGPSVSVQTTLADCLNTSGQIQLIASSGTPAYQFSINGSAFQASGIYSGLSAGIYSYRVRDANNCQIAGEVNLAASSGLNLFLAARSATCNGANGVIAVKASGGVPPYSYRINNGLYQIDSTFLSLSAGIYQVTVKDANNCIRQASATVQVVGAPLLTATPVNANCNSVNGRITLAGSGGTAPYQYSINGTVYQSSGLFLNIAPGTYTAYLKDASNCIVTAAVTIVNVGAGPGPTLTATADPATCNNIDGRIDADGRGGKSPRRYSIDGINFQSSSTFNNLAPGTYIVTVKDDNGCTASVQVTVTRAAAPVVDALMNASLCNASTGSLTVQTTGGTAPFQYSLDGVNFQTGALFSNLAAGAYLIRVLDANNCLSVKSAIVTNSNGPQLNVVKTDAYCSRSSGTLTVTGTGGTGILMYSINGVDFQVSNSFANLSSGTYTVQVRDENTCANSQIITLANLPEPSFSAIVSAAGCSRANGSITIQASGGLAPLTYSSDGINFKASPVFDSLPSGTYLITVLDANLCFSRQSVTVGVLPDLQLVAASVPTQCAVANGQLIAAASSGLAPYEYSLDNQLYQSAPGFSGLAAGGYTVFVKDAKGCVTSTRVVVRATDGPSLSAVATHAGCDQQSGSISVNAQNGMSPYLFRIAAQNYQSAPVFDQLNPGVYTVEVKDQQGCLSAVSVVVQAIPVPQLSLAATPASCVLGNGQLQALVMNGTAPYQYQLEGQPLQSESLFGTLDNGLYTIVVTDAQGCSDTAVGQVANYPLPELSAQVQASCSGLAIVTLTGSGSGNLFYQLDTAPFTSANVFAGVAAGTYLASVVDDHFCQQTIMVDVVTFPPGIKTWLGINQNWHDPVNWCNGVPQISDHVLVPSGSTVFPTISNGPAFCNNVTLEGGSVVTVIDTLWRIAGAVSGSGMIDAVAGRIELSGNAIQEIEGSRFVRNTIRELDIRNTSAEGVVINTTLGDTLKISRLLEFGYHQARLNTGGRLTLLSSDTATARIGVLEEDANGLALAIITGHITVERYFPRKRAWRLITAPLQADISAPSVNAAWQEGANPPSVTGVANPDPHPGYGTHITGPWNTSTAYSALVTASGFDQSPQNNSSMKYYSKSLQSYVPVTNTINTRVTDQLGWLLFVRGDRSYDISTTTNLTSPSSTILRASGNVQTGRVRIPVDTGIQVIGNPYPSAIILNEAFFNAHTQQLRNPSYWLWDPLRGAARNSPTNVGGWVPVVYLGGGTYFSTYDPSVSFAQTDSAHLFETDGTIQSGGGFLLDNQSAATGFIEFHESQKTSGSNHHAFRGIADAHSVLGIHLLRMQNERVQYWADGVAFLMHPDHDRIADDWDVRKVNGNGENLALVQDQTRLAISRMNRFNPGDTIPLEMIKMKAGSYEFRFYSRTWNPEPGLVVFLEDRYLLQQTPVNWIEGTQVSFELNANIPASYAPDRFRLIVASMQVLPIEGLHLQAADMAGQVQLRWNDIHPVVGSRYQLEYSETGSDFQIMPAFSYMSMDVHWYRSTDLSPFSGRRFYRMVRFSPDGVPLLSNTCSVYHSSIGLSGNLYPNPCNGDRVFLQLQSDYAARCQVELYDEHGRVVFRNELLLESGLHSYPVVFGNLLPKGHYWVRVLQGNSVLWRRSLIAGNAIE